MLKIINALVATAVLAAAAPSFAQTVPPTEVGARLANQNRRIDRGARQGQLTRREARRLHREDRRIRRATRRDELRRGGLTRREARRLNHRENRVSRQIHRERHGR
jgi:hypothetical protein